MNCPKCGYDHSRIVDTIRVDAGLRRHRICSKPRCRHRFRTLEREEYWDQTTHSYAPVAAAAPSGNVIQLQQEQPRQRTTRHVAHLNEACLAAVAHEAQPLLVEWWNVSRSSKHGSRAAWTENAWRSSVSRVSQLPNWKQVALARAGVEHGWQALKPEYVKDELQAPTAQGRPMPKDPAMLAALEEWPSQTA